MAPLITVSSIATVCLSLLSSTVLASPAYPLFAYPLPIPPTASPTYTIDVDGRSIDYYEITIEPFQKQVYPNLEPANLVGYNAITPGPTFWVQRYQQTVVRYSNKQQNNCSTHLHGSDNHAPWDGWADDVILPGQFKDYYYPNDHQARAIWYHDHADHVTADNAYSGLGGVYIIYDPAEDHLGLPSGDYDVSMTIADKEYSSSGQLVVPTQEGIDQYGDVVEVNGQPWPYMDVEPRKYRLRLFDLSLSRPWDLYIADSDGNWIEFQVIASDCGLFGSPVSSKDVQVAPGERYEIVFDFSPYAGQNLTMGNSMGSGPYGQIRTSDNTDKVMSFIVGSSVSDNSNNGDVPSTLNPNIQWPEKTTEVSHTFNFQVGGDARWTINGVDYDDVNNRVLARPEQGSTELWDVRYAGGPGTHPVHVHLVSFQILSRTGGSRGLLPYESAGLKDIVLIEPGESAEILAYYGPWNGLYMFHCHNLIHEDNGMMAAFNVTQLEGQGYNVTTDYADPSDPRFVARWPQGNTWDEDQISSTISFFAGLHAYDTTYTGSVSTSPPWSLAAGTTPTSVDTTNTATFESGISAATTGAMTSSYNLPQGGESYAHGQSYGGQTYATQSYGGQGESHGEPQNEAQSHGQDHQQGNYQNSWSAAWQTQHHRDVDAPAPTVQVVTKAVTSVVTATFSA